MASDYITQWDLNGDVYDVHDSDRGLPNGVATLNEDGIVPTSQLPKELPLLRNYPSWHDIAMFSSSYGVIWASRSVIPLYYNGYIYSLYTSSQDGGAIYKSKSPRFIDYNYGENQFTSLNLSSADSIVGIPYMFVDDVYLYVLCTTQNTNSAVTAHIYKFALSDGSLVFHAQQASTAFLDVWVLTTNKANCQIIAYNLRESGTTVTGYIGLPKDLTSSSLALPDNYADGITAMDRISSSSAVASVFFSAGATKQLMVAEVSWSPSGISSVTCKTVDSNNTYSVNALVSYDSTNLFVSDETSSKVYELRCTKSGGTWSIASAYNRHNGIADILYYYGTVLMILHASADESEVYINKIVKEPITVSLSSDFAGVTFSDCLYSNGRWILVGTYAPIMGTNGLIIWSSVDGRKFDIVYIEAIGAVYNTRIVDTGFTWSVLFGTASTPKIRHSGYLQNNTPSLWFDDYN